MKYYCSSLSIINIIVTYMSHQQCILHAAWKNKNRDYV